MTDDVVGKICLVVIGAICGAIIRRIVDRRRERVVLTFDFHKEFNSLEMAKHRKQADKLIELHPEKNFDELCVIEDDKSVSLLMIMRFYQRLWFSVKYRQVKKGLVLELFSDVFYHWHYISFERNLVPLAWSASNHINNLATWFAKYDKPDRHTRGKAAGDSILKQRLEVV